MIFKKLNVSGWHCLARTLYKYTSLQYICILCRVLITHSLASFPHLTVIGHWFSQYWLHIRIIDSLKNIYPRLIKPEPLGMKISIFLTATQMIIFCHQGWGSLISTVKSKTLNPMRVRTMHDFLNTAPGTW